MMFFDQVVDKSSLKKALELLFKKKKKYPPGALPEAEDASTSSPAE